MDVYVLIETREHDFCDPDVKIFKTYDKAYRAMKETYEEDYERYVPEEMRGEDEDFSVLSDKSAFIDFDGNDDRRGFVIKQMTIPVSYCFY